MKLIRSFLFSLVLFTGVSFADEVEDVVVTGSYIKGSATDGAAPVEIISRDTIELLGATTVADITRNLTASSGAENNADSFTSGSTQGTRATQPTTLLNMRVPVGRSGPPIFAAHRNGIKRC